jgi:hypothetical protein
LHCRKADDTLRGWKIASAANPAHPEKSAKGVALPEAEYKRTMDGRKIKFQNRGLLGAAFGFWPTVETESRQACGSLMRFIVLLEVRPVVAHVVPAFSPSLGACAKHFLPASRRARPLSVKSGEKPSSTGSATAHPVKESLSTKVLKRLRDKVCPHKRRAGKSPKRHPLSAVLGNKSTESQRLKQAHKSSLDGTYQFVDFGPLASRPWRTGGNTRDVRSEIVNRPVGLDVPAKQPGDGGLVWLKRKVRPKAHEPLEVIKKFDHLLTVRGVLIKVEPPGEHVTVRDSLIVIWSL